MQQLLRGALAELAAAATDGAPPAVDSAAVVQAAAGTITLLNGFLQQVPHACFATPPACLNCTPLDDTGL